MKTFSELMEPLVDDPRVGPLHVSMFVAIWRCWEMSGWEEVFMVRRKELMRMAKIQGQTTYYRVMRELREMGFIVYGGKKWKREGTVVGVG